MATTHEKRPPLEVADTMREEDFLRESLRGSALGGTSTMEAAPPVHEWDRYEILDLLGRGGMGIVHKARDRRLDRVVAIKFIHSTDPYITLRFVQEARAQARI